MPPEPELLQRFSAAPACYETFVSIPHLPHSYQRHCSCDPPSFVKDHREHFLCRGGLHRTLTPEMSKTAFLRPFRAGPSTQPQRFARTRRRLCISALEPVGKLIKELAAE